MRPERVELLGGSGRRRRPRGRARPARLPRARPPRCRRPCRSRRRRRRSRRRPRAARPARLWLREIEIHRPGKADRVPRRARQPEVVMQHALAENLVRERFRSEPLSRHARSTRSRSSRGSDEKRRPGFAASSQAESSSEIWRLASARGLRPIAAANASGTPIADAAGSPSTPGANVSAIAASARAGGTRAPSARQR